MDLLDGVSLGCILGTIRKSFGGKGAWV